MKLHLVVIALVVSVGLFVFLEADWLEREWFSWKDGPRIVEETRWPAPAPVVLQAVAATGMPQKAAKSPSRGWDSWILWCLVFAGVDAGICWYAKRAIGSIGMRPDLSNAEKLAEIANQDILFDLPLYVGLLGTILGFILISHGYSSSRDAAYISTVVGIVASAAMRLCILRPARAVLHERQREESQTSAQPNG